MAKANSVINSAASGITTRSHHTHFSDVNPIKPQGITREERWKGYVEWSKEYREMRKRQDKRRILYPV